VDAIANKSQAHSFDLISANAFFYLSEYFSYYARYYRLCRLAPQRLEEEGKAEEKQKTKPVKSNQSWDLLVTVVLPHPAGGRSVTLHRTSRLSSAISR
jgi:hypothetical protein